MWKPYTVSILYFLKKIFLLFIFPTLFCEICTFYNIKWKKLQTNTSSVQRKGADYAARALKSMIQGLGQIFQLFLKIWVMKVIAESMVKKLFVDFLGGKIGF